MLLRLLTSAAAAVLGAQLVKIISRLVYRRLYSPFRYMPGPPNPSLIYGNFQRLSQAQYGPTFKFHTLLSATQLYTIDTVALHHIVNSGDIYQRSPVVRVNMTQLLGRGLLAVEDDEHTKLRKIMSPAFGITQIRELTRLFVDKSLELCDVWARQTSDESGWTRIEVAGDLKRTTLDIIGLAGFDYEFNALKGDKNNELDAAFKQLFLNRNARKFTVAMLRARFPLLRKILPAPKRIVGARRRMDGIGMQLLQDAKAAISSGEKDTDTGRRDLLSLLVKANMSAEITESQRLNDAVVVAQLPTFFVAGHETTSTATAWALYALSQHPGVQDKLRAELLTMGTESPSLDALNALPYLEKFVREVMRVHSPVVFTNRMAMKDDVIPLGTPYTDTRGVQHDSIAVTKGQSFWVPVAGVNRDPRIWGADATEFKPDRWDAVPDAASAMPGIYANLFTFLGGPHNCIGWRFSLAEMKSLIYTLVRNFEFQLAVAPDEICTSKTAVQRPMLVAEPEKGMQLPMLVRRVQA
ncbi:cytochrome P450 [Mycena maculata]|uniref:Cytochrome P450 n=1 Tax=Mycena maculata TaxID=230809 RepID=A0AAD7K3C6_9AGAR|nr:cytochrome P450 [Mycena maculata]